MARISVAIFVLAMGVSAVGAQDLDRILQREKIALQKLQGDVNHALTQSRVLEKTDLAKANEMLLEATANVRNATELPADERARLLQRLQVRQREVGTALRAKGVADEQAPARVIDKTAPREAGPAGAGKTTAAPGKGSAAIAGQLIEARNAQLSAMQKSQIERTVQGNNVFAGLEKTATPINGVVEYPKHWDRIMERSKPKLTSREVALLRALNSTLSVDFNRTSFRDALEFIQEKAGMSIVVDDSSLKDSMVEYDDLVTFKIKGLTVRTILKKVLADLRLGYVIKEGTLHVLTAQKAREMMEVRVYSISDLLGNENPFIWGPLWKRAFELQHAESIVKMIQNSIEPSLWNVNGGPGAITYNDATKSIVVRASAEMHYAIGGSLLR